MKKILFLISLGCLLPLSQAWGGSTTTYWAKLTVSTSGTGKGTVYIDSNATSSASKSGSSSSSSVSISFNIKATAADGSEFAGWSDASGVTIGSTSSAETTATISASSSDQNKPTAGSVTAVFNEKSYTAFSVTFLKPSVGSYTIDGKDVGEGYVSDETTKPYSPPLVATVPLGYAFKRWYTTADGGATKVTLGTTSSYTPTFTAATTVGAEFSEAVEAKTLKELQDSLSQNDCTIIKSGTQIVIPVGTTLTVPDNRQLVNEGVLVAAGTLSGAAQITGGGKVLKIVKRISQSAPITPKNASAEYETFTFQGSAQTYKDTRVQYCTTALSSGGTVTGTPKCSLVSGVLLNDTNVFEIDKADPNALEVTFDTTKAINCISAISKTTVSAINKNGSFLLLKNTEMSGPTKLQDSKYTRYSFDGTIDLAGSKCTLKTDYQVGDYFMGRLVNGTFAYEPSKGWGDPSIYWQCGALLCINCPSVTVNNIKNTANNFYFFDCGTKTSPASFTVTYYNTSRTQNFRYAKYYSGVYDITFNSTDDKGNVQIFGGLYKNNPTDYLGKTDLIAKQSAEDNNYYLVREKQPGDDVVMIGDKGYMTLQAAVDAATSGDRLKVNNTIALTDKVTIASGKNLIIDLNGLNISGGSIENSGTLRFEDTSTVETKGTLSTPVTNKGSGTIDITYGTYANTFTLTGGSLTTHGGTFTSAFAVTQSGGTAHLHGGTFNGTLPVALETGYRKVGNKVGYYFEGGMTATTISGAQAAYSVKPLAPDEDYALYQKYLNGAKTRDKYSSNADWDRLAEMISSISPYEGSPLECTLSFDRFVAANTITGYGSVMGSTQNRALTNDVAVGSYYRMLKPIFLETSSGKVSTKAYKYFFTESSLQNAACGVANNSTALANIGTTCTIALQIYGGESPILCIASRTYKFTGNGAIYGSTDYTSLSEALTKAGYAGEVRLSKDCTETITVSATKTFTIDKNNFNFTGSVAGGTGYQVATTDLGSGKTQYAVTPIAYNITYYDGATELDLTPKTYTVETATFNLPTPEKTGYTFAGWYDNAELTGSAVTTITKGTTGAKKLYSKWTAINYTITYELNGGENDPANPATYTVESETITLKAPTKTGYTFAGWYDNAELTGSAVTTITKGTTGAKKLYSKWTAITYNITYTLNGGTNHADNPKTYTIESETITLKDPTKTDYNFTGWTPEGVIAKGSTGDKTFTAGWELALVTITIPDVEHTTKEIKVSDGEATLVSGDQYTVKPGVTVTVTYTAEAGYSVDPTQKVLENAKAGDKIDVKDIVITKLNVASIIEGGVTNSYQYLQDAFTAVSTNQTIDILLSNAESATIDKDYPFFVDLKGNTLTGTITCPQDWKFVDNGNDTWSYVEKVYVAQIVTGATTNKYETLDEALAVQSTDTVQVLTNLVLTESIAISGGMGGHLIDFDGYLFLGEFDLDADKTIDVSNVATGTLMTVKTASTTYPVQVTRSVIDPIFFQSWTNTYWATTNDEGKVALAAVSNPVVKDTKGADVAIQISDDFKKKYNPTGEEIMRTDQPMLNGMPAWQNDVLGLNPTNELSGVYADAPQNTETDKVTVVVQNIPTSVKSGYEIKGYQLTRPDGSVTNDVNPMFDIDIADDNPSGVYRLSTIIKKTDGDHELIAETVNTVGLIKQTQAVTNAIISVPWGKLAPGYEDIAVSNVVKTATLDEGDELRVYRPGLGRKYESWKLKANKEWEPGGIVDEKGNVIKSAESQVATIPKGSGIWLCRKDSSKPYYLYGQADSTESAVELEKGANLVGATGTEDYDLNEHITGAQAGDTITVPGEKDVPMIVEFKDDAWGHWTTVTTNIIWKGKSYPSTMNVWKTDTVVRPGTGFWLHNKSGNIKVK